MNDPEGRDIRCCYAKTPPSRFYGDPEGEANTLDIAAIATSWHVRPSLPTQVPAQTMMQIVGQLPRHLQLHHEPHGKIERQKVPESLDEMPRSLPTRTPTQTDPIRMPGGHSPYTPGCPKCQSFSAKPGFYPVCHAAASSANTKLNQHLVLIRLVIASYRIPPWLVGSTWSRKSNAATEM